MMTEAERIVKRRLHQKRYRENNRATINARKRAKKLRQRATEMPAINEQLNITKKEIAKLVGVKMMTIEKILKDKKYGAPKHTGMHFDGTVLFIREASAFIGKGRPIKITGVAAQIVEFMHRNKKVELFCNDIRRKQMDERINNGQGY